MSATQKYFIYVSFAALVGCGSGGGSSDGDGATAGSGGEGTGGAGAGGAGGAGGAAGAPSTGEPAFSASTDPLTLGPGEEILEACQGFRFDNDETLWVNAIRITAPSGVHHSDWLVLPEDVWTEPSVAAVCDDYVDPVEGPFSLFTSAVMGDVLFAQSTQSTSELQDFGEGTAMAVPPRSQLFVYYHLLNTSPETADIKVDVDLYTIPEEETVVKLKDMAGFNFAIDVPAREKSRFSADCMFPNGQGGDFSVYFVLPHYHYYGTGMKWWAIGGPNDGQLLFDTAGSTGEPLAERLDPPASLEGADGLRFSCEFTNNTDTNIPWGVGADDEMCFFLLHTDSNVSWAATSSTRYGATQTDLGFNAEGIHEYRSTGCPLIPTDAPAP